MNTANGFLTDCRVLDLTDPKGMFCGKILGDLGADVVKVEPPGGDPGRNVMPFYQGQPHPERSLLWYAWNTSKRSITLNLEAPDGQDILRRLAAGAHFVVESFSPGYMEGLGLGYDALSAINPGLVMVSITPYGQTGPYALYKTCDLTGVATGGLLFLTGDGDRPPVRINASQAYFQAGLQAATGAMIAHYYRQTTGEGQYVDVSMQEAVLRTLFTTQVTWNFNHVNRQREGVPYDQGPPLGVAPLRPSVYRCRDGHMGVAVSDMSIRAIVGWMHEAGMDGEISEWIEAVLASNPKLSFVGQLGPAGRDRMEVTLTRFLAAFTKAELQEGALQRHLMFGTVNTPGDLLRQRQLLSRGFFVDVDHPELGTVITYPGAPFRASLTPWRIQHRAPLVGEHNHHVYCQEVGISPRRLAALKAGGVI
ncbi:MAG: CoA transferase [Chloroflexi bacterium]|nr:CoA transferase [Chloroflexota bacterium]